MKAHTLKFLSLSVLLLINLIVSAQPNILLDRAFWKQQPSLEEVKSKIAEGHDPAELNRFAFDALSWALIEKNPMTTLKFLLDQPGNSVNKLTHDGRTYIFWAAYRDNLEFMKYLVDKGAATNIIDDHGYSLLNFAAVTGQANPKLYDFIIANGAQVKEERNHDGAHALLLVMPFLEDEEMVRYFEQKGLNLKDTDKDGSNAYHYAAKGGHIEMLEWLTKQKLESDISNQVGENAMHFAAMGTRGKTNGLDVFQYLESKNVVPTAITKSGNTPLTYYATKDMEEEVVKYFIKKGMNVNQVTKNGYNALINASVKGSEEIITLLAENTTDLNHANKKGETALAIAVRYNSPQVVKLLLKKGADPECIDTEGNSLVYYLIESYSPRKVANFQEKFELLKEAGLDFSTAQGGGNNFYPLAAQRNSLDLLKMAREMELDINVKNEEGLTPLHVAAMKANKEEMLKYLIAQGADKHILTDFDESVYELASENEILQKKQINLKFLEE